ncbi:hypothetical protein LOTGIDRAFT_175806 [Lottia gigantea]|uniref:Uncharacterized protein n=1 Tax=Lottia gigantea TaxID=225164 RepID=V4A6U4_LOTGI|nr:hypothetical protein LOTGIDRAFT_175806 [Lottia gigantea]ESO90740.1 hypothetical protein LOTGIDRAFT_175806 [Lottia gigantea]
MAEGLMSRFENSQKDLPKCLYTDRECCNQDGPSKFKVLFSKWTDLKIRLDIWHFMRRLALGCTSESHPLYGTFMSRLSSAIFEWDKTDLANLKAAKKKEIEASGIPNPSESAINKAITKGELESLTGVTDSLGVAILKEELNTIWSEQKKHVACIQDMEGLKLYTVTGDMSKVREKLPVYRCARGSTSLESFHSHMVKFIPGTSASVVNFQAYLLDGVSRWNYLRSAAAMNVGPTPFRTFDFRLTQKVNSLSQSLHNKSLVPVHMIPAEYTGELIGIEYLYKQSGFLLPKDEELEAEIDEGFEDFEDDAQQALNFGNELEEDVLPAAPVYSSDSEDDEKDDDDQEEEEEEEELSVSVDSRGIPGWDKVEALALALIQLKGISITAAEANNIKQLFDVLLDFDRRPIKYTAKVKKPSKGRFARSKGGFVGVDAVKRYLFNSKNLHQAYNYYIKIKIELNICIVELLTEIEIQEFNIDDCFLKTLYSPKIFSTKKKEIEASGIPNPSESAINKAITKGELERHCRRRTRGVKKTTEEIESLILSLTGVTDSLGVAILKEVLNTIWSEQKKHVACIQDMEGLKLYTVTGDMSKGREKLPVYRCARGSTSLESFHSHMVKFIPGTSASAVNFQAYLLDGVSRWNYLRSAAAMNQFLHVEPTENSFIPTKTGLPTSEWIKRLSDYASGTFLFGRGQRPSTGSRWAKELTAIDNCPRHKSVVKKDLFGNVVQCSCEYHKEKATSKPSTSHSSTPSATVTSAESGQGDIKVLAD